MIVLRAQFQSEILTRNSEIGRLKREKSDVEAQLRRLQNGVMEKTEWKDKYTQLKNRFDVSLLRMWLWKSHITVYAS